MIKMASHEAEKRIAELEEPIELLKRRIAMHQRMAEFSKERRAREEVRANIYVQAENDRLKAQIAALTSA